MNAVCVYVSTAQLVLQTDPADANTVNEQRLLDLSQQFAQLRQLLSCAVCTRLLNDPYAPLNETRCQHNVCRLCVRGRKCLRPLCNSCKDLQDFKAYTENRQMRCLLLCYKSLCEHLLNSSYFVQLCRQKQLTAGYHDHMTTQEIVLEGARYEDVLSVFNADLPHAPAPKLALPSSPLLPTAVTQSVPLSVSAVTPLAPHSATSHMRVHMQPAPKAATPPTSSAIVSSTYVVASPTPTIATVKHEPTTPSLPVTSATHAALSTTKTCASSMPLQPLSTTHVQSVYVKHLKPHSGESVSTQSFLSTAHTTTAGSASLTATPTITYVGPNTPGIVVPIVSSSATTTAPLTIASAKLQSLNRQLAHARLSGAVKTATLSGEGHPPLTFKVATVAANISSTATSTTNTINHSNSSSSTNTTATVTSQQIRNPPPIKTVSNGSAMYSVLYTGVGNKITIKRKTDGDDDSSQRKNATTSSSTSSATATPAFRQQVPTGNASASAAAAKLNSKRRGCRCGNATATPGKLTCCGQRCPCYVESKSCIGCKCRGCRNPHRPDGGKVRPVIPELACYEIQMADESASLSPSELPVATTASIRTSSPSQQQATHTVPQQTYNPEGQSSTVMSQINLNPVSSSSNAATLIPFINLQTVTTQQQQQQTQKQQTLDSLQRESVYIQNAEGKYQVVNVFTAGPHNQNVTSIQRIHSISQLQAGITSTSSSNATSVSTANILTNVPTPTVSPTTNTSNSNNTLSQMFLQHQQQRQQLSKQQQQHRNSANLNATSITLQQPQRQYTIQQQQQQHLKTGNVTMTMRAPASSTQTQTTMPLLSAVSAANNTITLSPIIVASPNNFTPEMFSDSSDEFLSLASTSNSGTANLLTMSSSAPTRYMVVPPAQASPLSLSSGNSSSGSGSTSGADMNMTVTGSHLAPTLVEVIEAGDV